MSVNDTNVNGKTSSPSIAPTVAPDVFDLIYGVQQGDHAQDAQAFSPRVVETETVKQQTGSRLSAMLYQLSAASCQSAVSRSR